MTMIEVTTGSRLHFGLICSSPATQWRFGGIGVMLRQPAWRLRINRATSNDDTISASQAVASRIREFLGRIRTTRSIAAVSVIVQDEYPFHTGLGGGTQLGMALAAGTELLHSRRLSEDPFQLAQLLDRAERSAIGTMGFSRGGFLIDHGDPTDHDTTVSLQFHRQVDRISFPEHWQFVLACPVDSQGLSGKQEQSFFGKRVNMPQELVRDLGQKILDQIAPSIIAGQFSSFAKSLEDYGRKVGAFYAEEQGGVFAHSAMNALADCLRSRGIAGMAQSSWGPLIAIPAESPEHAAEIVRLIRQSTPDGQLNVTVSEPLNAGATIRSIIDDSGTNRML